ncbi:MAG: ferritin family protein [Deltaproteobacteria bacterium]|nr:ferritin family protein [Deltaproteobacteria bacterium]
MDLSKFSENTLLVAAIKSEIDSKEIYQHTANRVNNALLKDKLTFLASEEVKHRNIIEGIYKDKFPDEALQIPEKSPVPMPELIITDEMLPMSEVFLMAMNAEKASYDFYNELAKMYESNLTLKKTIEYVATMEMGHYKLIEIEKDNMIKFEDFDIYLPMIHVGA